MGRVPESSARELRGRLFALYSNHNAALHDGKRSAIDHAHLRTISKLLTSLLFELQRAIEDGHHTLAEFRDYVDRRIRDQRETLRRSLETASIELGRTYAAVGTLERDDGDHIADVTAELRFVEDGAFIRAFARLDDVDFSAGTHSSNDVLTLRLDIDGRGVEFGPFRGHRIIGIPPVELSFGNFEIS